MRMTLMQMLISRSQGIGWHCKLGRGWWWQPWTCVGRIVTTSSQQGSSATVSKSLTPARINVKCLPHSSRGWRIFLERVQSRKSFDRIAGCLFWQIGQLSHSKTVAPFPLPILPLHTLPLNMDINARRCNEANQRIHWVLAESQMLAISLN